MHSLLKPSNPAQCLSCRAVSVMWTADLLGGCNQILQAGQLVNNRNFFFYSSGGWKSEIRVPRGQVRALLQTADSLYPSMLRIVSFPESLL